MSPHRPAEQRTRMQFASTLPRLSQPETRQPLKRRSIEGRNIGMNQAQPLIGGFASRQSLRNSIQDAAAKLLENLEIISVRTRVAEAAEIVDHFPGHVDGDRLALPFHGERQAVPHRHY